MSIGEAAGPYLIKALEDPDRNFRGKILQVLRNSRADLGPAVPRLIDLMKESGQQFAVLELLARCGPAAAPAVPALIGYLAKTEDGYDFHAVSALGGVGSAAAPAVPTLIRALESGMAKNDIHVLVYTTIALGKIGPSARQSLPMLNKLTAHESEPVRKAVVEAIRLIQH